MADFDTNPYNLTADPLSGGGTYGEGRIGDALTRLRGLQSALQSGQIDYNTYQQLFNQFNPTATQTIQGIGGGGSKAASAANAAGAPTYANLSNIGGQDLQTFSSIFKNLTGKNASADDFTKYFSNVPGILGSGPSSYADVNSALNSYISNTYQPQIQAYQKGQQTSALQDAQKSTQDLINNQTQQTINQLTSPQTAEQLKEAYNANGMLDSGAFSQGVANTLSNATANNMSQALGAITLPGISNIMGTSNAPYESFLGNLNPNLQSFGSNQTNYSNFQLQKDLADQIASMNSPTTLQKWAPIIQSGIQAGGMVGAGAAGRPGGTYICTHLKKLGLMTAQDVQNVHDKVFPYAFLKPFDLLKYNFFAPAFIIWADQAGFDWAALKPRVCDEIIACTTQREAFKRYKAVCLEIFQQMKVIHG